jgi:L-glyceraldehyde 3-phosphate reductase
MWPGPYGDVGDSRKYLVVSCNQSLKCMGLEYVDHSYSHRVDAETPLKETRGAFATLHHQDTAAYVGISSYSPDLTVRAAEILKPHRVPLLIHWLAVLFQAQLLDRGELLETLGNLGIGCIAFSPPA